MGETPRAMLAELVGTFAFVTIGAGALVLTQAFGSQLGLLGLAFAHGLVLAVLVSLFARISGGHFNPAVTVGLWVGGKIDSIRAAGYVVSQLVGGLAAGLLLRAIFTPVQWEPTNLGTPSLAAGFGEGRAILLEAVLTFLLLLAVWGTVVDPRSPAIGGFGVGLTFFVGVLVGGPLTGGAMNPARWFGPAVASGFFDDWWVYWVGPIAGAVLASLLYRYVFHSDEHERGVPAAVGQERLQETPHA